MFALRRKGAELKKLIQLAAPLPDIFIFSLAIPKRVRYMFGL
jgi:hypothetical protein